MSLGINLEVKAGRLTRDPEVKTYTKNGEEKEMVVFTIAINEKLGKEKTDVQFVNCVAYNGLVGVIKQYFEKGSGIIVSGRGTVREYEQDGVTKKNYSLIVNKFNFPGNGFEITFIDGRTTSKGELQWRDFGNGEKQAVYRVTVAVNRRWTDNNGEKQQAANFYNVEFTGNYAETLSNKVSKGDAVMVTGSERFNSVEREDGDGYDRYQKLRGWDLKWSPLAVEEGSIPSEEDIEKAKEQEEPEDLELDENLDNVDEDLDDLDDFEKEMQEFDGLDL